MRVSLKEVAPVVADRLIGEADSSRFLVVTKAAGGSSCFVPGAVVMKNVGLVTYIRTPTYGAGGWDSLSSVADGRVRNMTAVEQINLRPSETIPAPDAFVLGPGVTGQRFFVVVSSPHHRPGSLIYTARNSDYLAVDTSTYGPLTFAKSEGITVRPLRPGEVVTIEA